MQYKKTQVFLRTPGACFLCLKDIHTDKDSNGGIVDLGRICRYLNINQHSILITSLKNDGSTGDYGLEQGQCTFSVNLCPECRDLSAKLNYWMIQLEKAKAMVNYHMHSFHNILEGNEDWEESLEWINLLGRMNADPNHTFESKLVELFRKRTRDNAFEALKKAEADQPQVILSKCDAPPPPQYTSHRGTSAPSMKSLLKNLVATNTIPSNKLKVYFCRCPYCDKVLNHCKLRVHLSCIHSDKLLSSFFTTPSLNPTLSEAVCRQVLYSQVILKASKIPSPSNPTALPRLGCHVCGITYSDGNLLKQHFLISHTDNLYQAVTSFGENSQKMQKRKTPKPCIRSTIHIPSKTTREPKVPDSVEDLIKNIQESSLIDCKSSVNVNKDNATSRVIKRCQCQFCQNSMDFLRFPHHLANHHPDKLLAPFVTATPALNKLKNAKPNVFSQLCNNVLAKQLDKAAKITPTCTPATMGGRTSLRFKFECPLCLRTYPKRINLKYHFVVDHINDLVRDLEKMQNLKMGLRYKNKIIKKARNSKPSPEVKKIKKRSLEEKTCPTCGYIFNQVGKLKRHLVTMHPGQLFLGCKPEETGDDQWREICKEVYKKEVKRATYDNLGDKIFKCGYCPLGGERNYKGYIDLVVHLVYQHREEMVAKLEEFEKNMNVFGGGDVDVYGGKDYMYFGSLQDTLYPDMVLALNSDKNEVHYQETDDF